MWLDSDSGAVPGNDYSLDIDVSTSATCSDDSFEPNDSLGAAAAIAPGSYPSLEIGASDLDWFKVDAPASQQFTVRITFSHSQGDLDMSSHDGSGGQLNLSQSVSNAEQVTVSGGQLVKVFGYNGARGGYTLTLTQQ